MLVAGVADERVWWGTDPRGDDLPVDSSLWSTVLTWSYELDGGDPDGLFGSLRGMRCLGARLEETPSGVRLRPGELLPVWGGADCYVARKS